jgi:hypothetical protein
MTTSRVGRSLVRTAFMGEALDDIVALYVRLRLCRGGASALPLLRRCLGMSGHAPQCAILEYAT